MNILALDPGTTETGWCRLINGSIAESGIGENRLVMAGLMYDVADVIVLEMMRARGMPVSDDEMKTLVWIGRFQQAWRNPEAVQFVYRGDVKMHVCGQMKAKDANIRQALLDRFGPQGTKKKPGPTFGLKSHSWAALAVAVTFADVAERKQAEGSTGNRLLTKAEFIAAEAPIAFPVRATA